MRVVVCRSPWGARRVDGSSQTLVWQEDRDGGDRGRVVDKPPRFRGIFPEWGQRSSLGTCQRVASKAAPPHFAGVEIVSHFQPGPIDGSSPRSGRFEFSGVLPALNFHCGRGCCDGNSRAPRCRTIRGGGGRGGGSWGAVRRRGRFPRAMPCPQINLDIVGLSFSFRDIRSDKPYLGFRSAWDFACG